MVDKCIIKMTKDILFEAALGDLNCLAYPMGRPALYYDLFISMRRDREMF